MEGPEKSSLLSIVSGRSMIFALNYPFEYPLGWYYDGGIAGCRHVVESLLEWSHPRISVISFGALLIICRVNAAMIPPTVYYSKVGIELAKLVFRGQNMTPP